MFSWKKNVLLIALILLATTAHAQDASVISLEVSQAFQKSDNSIDLVSDRSIVVRARVEVADVTPIPSVTGRLRVFVDGVEVTSGSGVAPINPSFVPPTAGSWDRDNEDHTLNFEIIAPTGIGVTNNADFVVELDPISGETNTANNTGRADDLVVVERISPKLYYTRINYTPAGAGLPNLSDIRAGVGDSFVRGIYPIDDSDSDLYLEGLFPTLNWSQDPNGNNMVDDTIENSDILDWLESCRQLIVEEEGNGDTIFLYGWIEGNPILSNGWGQTGGRVGFGNTQLSRHQRTYAHELGHNFGLSHNGRTLSPDSGWDTGARLDGNPSGNNTTGRVKASSLRDIMVGGRLTNQAWIDEETYTNFLGNNVLQSDGDVFSDKYFQRRIVAISGVLNSEGNELVRLNPTFRYPWRSQPSFSGLEGRFTTRVVTENGDIFEQNFTGQLGDDTNTDVDPFGFFSVRVAVPENQEIERVEIIDRISERFLATAKRNEPPRISILDPQPGDVLEGDATVQFEVDDPDTNPENIRVHVAYSHDQGINWVPVAVNVPAAQGGTTFNVKEVVSSTEGVGMLRVIAADDGLNTVFDDVSKLTVLGGGKPR